MDDGIIRDFRAHLAKLDFTAMESARDKVAECRFFLDLASAERARPRFRWLLSAFLNAAYSYFEMVAVEAHYKFCDDDGNPYADDHALEVLAQHVSVEKTGSKGRVKVIARSALTRRLFEVRKQNTHLVPLSIMEVGTDLPEDFRLGQLRGEGEPALALAREVMVLVEQVQSEFDA